MNKLNLDKPICFLDLETTGLNVKKDRIVEIGLIKISKDSNKEYTSLVNPEIEIPKEAFEVHGINNELVQDEPTLSVIAPKLLSFIEDCILAGFNILEYDLKLLFWDLNRVGVQFEYWKYPILDIKVLHDKIYRRNLSSLYEFYTGQKPVNAHTAIEDVRMTREILDKQYEKHNLPEFSSELVDFANWSTGKLDFSNKFILKDGQAYFNFGSNKGVLCRSDKAYLTWMLTSDFDEDVKIIAKAILDGKIK